MSFADVPNGEDSRASKDKIPVFDHSYLFIDGTGKAKPFLETDFNQLIDRYGFKPLRGRSENFGYEHRVHWILVPLKDIIKNPSGHYLELNYPLIDYLDVYQFDGEWQLTHQTGDMRPFESRPLEHRVFFFPLKEQVQHLLIRAQTQGSLIIPLAIVNETHIKVQQRKVTLAYGLFFGALGIMCVYNLFVFFFTRETGYFYYVSTLFFILIYLVAMSGHGYEWLWRTNGQWVNAHIQPITVGMILANVSLFTRQVLQLPMFFPRLSKVFAYLARFCIGVALVGFFLPLSMLIHFISFLPLVVISLVIYSGMAAYNAKVSGAGLFLLAWSAGLVGALLFALHQLGVLPSNGIFVHGLKFGVLLNTVLLSFTLVAHINFLKQEKVRAEALAHENYRLALVDGLTNIPNRRAFDHQYRLEFRRSQRENTPLSLLMVDVDFFKRYNDTLGHRKGDLALKKVARVMSQALSRPADSIYRYGGEEFVVLLPDTDQAGAAMLAQRIVDSVIDEKLPHPESPYRFLTVSIGIATDNKFEHDSLALLEEADEALYRAKSEGRNRFKAHQEQSNVHRLPIS